MTTPQSCSSAAAYNTRSSSVRMYSINRVVSPRTSPSSVTSSAITLLALPPSTRPKFTRVIPSLCRAIPYAFCTAVVIACIAFVPPLGALPAWALAPSKVALMCAIARGRVAFATTVPVGRPSPTWNPKR